MLFPDYVVFEKRLREMVYPEGTPGNALGSRRSFSPG